MAKRSNKGRKAERQRQLRRLASFGDVDPQKVKAELDAEPDLHSDLVWIWNAFWALHQSRQAGMGPQAISIQEIHAYCQLRRIDDPYDLEQLLYCLQKMDGAWLDWQSRMRGHG